MFDSTSHLALPYLLPSQAQKHVTHNEALRMLDGLVQLSVRDRDRTAAPDDPGEGDRHLVGPEATGDWSGWDRAVAYFAGGGWTRLAPRAGWRAWVEAESALVVFDGADWAGITSSEQQNLSLLGIGTTADAAAPFAAKLNAALWAAKTADEGGSGDLRYTLNKEAAANVLSILLQTGWSARAELGLMGDDNFVLKVSPDGSTWHDALVVDATTGTLQGYLPTAGGTMTGALEVPSGSQSAPALASSAEAATGHYFAGVEGVHVPCVTIGDSYCASFAPAGPGMPASQTVVTREKGDARYHRLGDRGVGNIALCQLQSSAEASIPVGGATAGSNLKLASISNTALPVYAAYPLSGTWRTLSGCNISTVGLWERIS